MTEALEPEARAGLRPAWTEPPAGNARIRDRSRIAAGILVALVLILGIVVGLGELVVKDGNGNVLCDETIPHWFASHRTHTGDRWSLVFTTLGATQAILIVSLAACVVFLAIILIKPKAYGRVRAAPSHRRVAPARMRDGRPRIGSGLAVPPPALSLAFASFAVRQQPPLDEALPVCRCGNADRD